MSKRILFTAAGVAMVLGASSFLMAWNPAPRGPKLNASDIQTILNQAEAAANAEASGLRPGAMTKMHIWIVNDKGMVIGKRSMSDAWLGSISIARAKAFTAMAFSSDENALTSRSIGELSQPGQPLWQIGNSNKIPGLIEFPGGLPLYKGGELVGGIGVSGDGVDQDENVAEAGAVGYEPAPSIRIDTVSGGAVSYTQ